MKTEELNERSQELVESVYNEISNKIETIVFDNKEFIESNEDGLISQYIIANFKNAENYYNLLSDELVEELDKSDYKYDIINAVCDELKTNYNQTVEDFLD